MMTFRKIKHYGWQNMEIIDCGKIMAYFTIRESFILLTKESNQQLILYNDKLGLPTHPAVARSGSMGKLQLRNY